MSGMDGSRSNRKMNSVVMFKQQMNLPAGWEGKGTHSKASPGTSLDIESRVGLLTSNNLIKGISHRYAQEFIS